MIKRQIQFRNLWPALHSPWRGFFFSPQYSGGTILRPRFTHTSGLFGPVELPKLHIVHARCLVSLNLCTLLLCASWFDFGLSNDSRGLSLG